MANNKTIILVLTNLLYSAAAGIGVYKMAVEIPQWFDFARKNVAEPAMGQNLFAPGRKRRRLARPRYNEFAGNRINLLLGAAMG